MGFGEWLLGSDYNPAKFNPEQYQYNADSFGLGSRGSAYGDRLSAMMDGRGPSAAEAQLNAGLGRILSSQASQVGSMSGMNPGMAARMAQRNTAEQSAQTQYQAAIARAQEQAAAGAQYGAFLENDRQAQMALENARGNQSSMAQQLLAQQALQNAQNSKSQGFLGTALNAAAGLGAAYISGPMTAANMAGQAMGGMAKGYTTNPAYAGSGGAGGNPWAAPYLNPYGGRSYGGGV